MECDQRLTFCTPSLAALELPGRDHELLLLFLWPGSKLDWRRAVNCGPNSSGLLGRVAEAGVLDPDLEDIEAAFFTVTTEDESELVLDDFLRVDRAVLVEFSMVRGKV